MSRTFRVDELLKDQPEDRAEFEQFARVPGRTIDDLHEWLLARGYQVVRSSVHRWKQKFDEQLIAERFHRNSELAAAIKGAVEQDKFESVADAAVMQLTNVVFEQAARLEAEQQLDPLDIQRMTRALNNLIGGKGKLVQMLAERFDREMKQLAKEARKTPADIFTPERIAEARKRIYGI